MFLFYHSVCHLAGEFINHLRKRQQKEYESTLKEGGVEISYKDELCVRLAGLCHDLGKKHKGMQEREIQSLLCQSDVTSSTN